MTRPWSVCRTKTTSTPQNHIPPCCAAPRTQPALKSLQQHIPPGAASPTACPYRLKSHISPSIAPLPARPVVERLAAVEYQHDPPQLRARRAPDRFARPRAETDLAELWLPPRAFWMSPTSLTPTCGQLSASMPKEDSPNIALMRQPVTFEARHCTSRPLDQRFCWGMRVANKMRSTSRSPTNMLL